MQYKSEYDSPLGKILLTADKTGLTGLWFADRRPVFTDCEAGESPFITEAKRWLDIYFSGKEPDFAPPLHIIGTPFQIEVWEILGKIPYGETLTYGDIAKELAARRGIARMAAQAVGGAVGSNKISIILPCHRVVGAKGALTGYGGGIERKIALLEIEKESK